MKQIPLLLTIVLLCSCNVDGDRISVNLSFQIPGTKTFSPDVSLEPVSFTVSGSGPSEEEFFIETDGYAVEIHEVLCGKWTIAISGLDDDGNIILYGETEIVIQRSGPNNVTIILQPVEGTGSLSVHVSWPEAALSEPSVICSLEGESGLMEMGMTVKEDGAASTADYPSGYYTLRVILFDDEEEICGGAETVRIISGYTTEAVFDFTAYDTLFRTSLVISADIDQKYPPAVTVQGPDMLLSGDTAEYTASGPGNVDKTRWFLNGHEITVGEEFSLPLGPRKKMNRIDAEMEDQDGDTRGSGTLWVREITPEWIGDLSCFRTYKNGEGEISLMSGVRDGAGKDGVYAAAGYNSDGVAFFSYNPGANKLDFCGAHKHSEITGPCSVRTFSGGFIVAGHKSNSLGICNASGYIDVFADTESIWLSGPRGICVYEEYLYVLNEDNNTLVLFSLDNSILTPEWIYDFHDVPSGYSSKPHSIKIFDAGTKAAVTFFGSDSIVFFTRDTQNGHLEYSISFKDETGSITGLNGPSNICVYGDGKFLYITGYYDDSVLVFRDDGAGIDYAGCVKQGNEGVEALDMPRGVESSRSGKYLYVASGGSDGISVFTIQDDTGMLGYVGFLQPAAGPEDMDSPRSLHVMEGYPVVLVCSAGSSTVSQLAVKGFD
jgi:DNA-binding beta-propeller fold protein YncE